MNGKEFLSLFLILCFIIFSLNFLVAVKVIDWMLDMGDVFIATMWVFITFVTSGFTSLLVLDKMGDLIEIEEKKVIK